MTLRPREQFLSFRIDFFSEGTRFAEKQTEARLHKRQKEFPQVCSFLLRGDMYGYKRRLQIEALIETFSLLVPVSQYFVVNDVYNLMI